MNPTAKHWMPESPPGSTALELDAHQLSSHLFYQTSVNELALGDYVSQWTEWLDGLLDRRFATSVILVGAVAALIALGG